jgi:hypothetical protein
MLLVLAACNNGLDLTPADRDDLGNRATACTNAGGTCGGVCAGDTQHIGDPTIYSCTPAGTTIANAACCLPAPPCSDLTDAPSCEARLDCHSLFKENNECDCAEAFCCGGMFSSCATGKTTCAPSSGVVVEAPPYTCGASTYVYSYDPKGQIDGCTLASECPP